jgi:hypothetical protein
MTMLDMKCDVCQVNPPIGVASTHIPYSCAYCVECLKRHADPESVFEVILQETKDANLTADDVMEGLVTYKNGGYISFKEWAAGQ